MALVSLILMILFSFDSECSTRGSCTRRSSPRTARRWGRAGPRHGWSSPTCSCSCSKSQRKSLGQESHLQLTSLFPLAGRRIPFQPAKAVRRWTRQPTKSSCASTWTVPKSSGPLSSQAEKEYSKFPLCSAFKFSCKTKTRRTPWFGTTKSKRPSVVCHTAVIFKVIEIITTQSFGWWAPPMSVTTNDYLILIRTNDDTVSVSDSCQGEKVAIGNDKVGLPHFVTVEWQQKFRSPIASVADRHDQCKQFVIKEVEQTAKNKVDQSAVLGQHRRSDRCESRKTSTFSLFWLADVINQFGID